jgi:hypothetical protein
MGPKAADKGKGAKKPVATYVARELDPALYVRKVFAACVI